MLEKGCRVLVNDKEDEWIPGLVEALEGPNKYRIKTDNGKSIQLSDKECVQISDKSLQNADDMCSLDELHQGIILHNLRQRYYNDVIYTYIGPMIVSVNPYRNLDQYGEHLIPEYRSKEKDQLLPHPYALAQKAYKSMVDFNESQCVIISGESGAGKTEATKIVLKFLTVASGSSATTGSPDDLASMILATNPILESFGNSKTTRNNNSSRFGKFIRINFSGSKISGAQIDNYLLEKTRLVSQAPTERSYHIFYQLINGSSSEQKQKYKLKSSPSEYAYLTNGNVEVEGIDDVQWFNSTISSFRILGFKDDEIEQIFSILSGILSLGNINFSPQSEDEAVIQNEETLNNICELFGVLSGITKQALTLRTFTSGRGTITKVPLTRDQAIENRDALAKSLYFKLFDWLVQRLNVLLQGSSNESGTKFIGVLDIYGFEIFQVNSLEQFCINYANEKLHQQFNQHMFKAEQEEYTKDGVPWQEIKFKDNQGCIDLIEKIPRGIIGILAEQGRMPRGSDESFQETIAKNFRGNLFIDTTPQYNDRFTIRHFAGPVEYNTKNFLEKNRDTLNNDVIKAMKTTEKSILKEFYKDELAGDEEKKGEEAEQEDSTAGRRATFGKNRFAVGGRDHRKSVTVKPEEQRRDRLTTTEKFRQDLGKLVTTLNASSPHYIRCIKPNDTKKAKLFDSPKCMGQLACNGVLETVTLRKAGFPNRMTFDRFLDRFFVCLGPNHTRDKEGISACLSELMKDQHLWAVGHSKVFLRDLAMETLADQQKKAWEGKATTLQTFIRCYFAKQKYEKLLQMAKSSIVFQRYIRMFRAIQELIELRRLWEEKVRRVTKLQCFARRYFAQKLLEEKRRENNSAISLQNIIRRWSAINQLEELRELYRQKRIACATTIANFVRRWIARNIFLELEAEKKRKEEEERKRREEEEKRQREEAERIRLQKEAEEKARKEAEEKIRREKEAEEAARREAEEKLRKEKEAEENARREAEEKLRKEKEAEENARREAEEKLRKEKEAEENAKREAEEKLRREKEAEENARREAEEKLRKEKEAAENAKREAEEKAQREKEAQEKARLDAEEKARREEAEKIRLQKEAEGKAQREKEAQEKAQLEAEEKTQREEAERIRKREAAEKIRLQKETEEKVQREKEAQEKVEAKENDSQKLKGQSQVQLDSQKLKGQPQPSHFSQKKPSQPKLQPKSSSRQLLNIPTVSDGSGKSTSPRVPLLNMGALDGNKSSSASDSGNNSGTNISKSSDKKIDLGGSHPPSSARSTQSARGVQSARGINRRVSVSFATPPALSLAPQSPTPADNTNTLISPRERKVSVLVANSSDSTPSKVSAGNFLKNSKPGIPPVASPGPTISLSISADDKKRLEEFLAEIGLESLLDTFVTEAVDLDTMLAWEDPKKELSEIGIYQKGVLFRIAKGIETYKTKFGGVKSELLSGVSLSPREAASPQKPQQELLTPRRGAFGGLFGGPPAEAGIKSEVLPQVELLTPRSRGLFGSTAPPEPVVPVVGAPITISILRGKIVFHEKVGGVSFSGKLDLYARAFAESPDKSQKLTIFKTIVSRNSNPLEPVWGTPGNSLSTFQMTIPEKWNLNIEVWDNRNLGDVKVGEYIFQNDDLKLLRKGRRWIPVKHQGVFGGEIEIAVMDIQENDLEIEWEDDILGDDFVQIKFPLLPDEKGGLDFSLVRLSCEYETTAAVIYLHDFSDYFWNGEIADRIAVEGYHFYAIDFRRYGRVMRENLTDERQNHSSNLQEFYEEIHLTINFLRDFEKITKILIIGQGLGGLIASLFLSDHPDSPVEGLCLVSPFFALNKNWVDNVANLAKTWIGGFDPNFSCKNFSRVYHECLHKNFKGDWDWDLNKKPLDGFPIYAGWVQMIAETQQKVRSGLNIGIPVLILLCNSSSVPKEFSEECLGNDIIMNVRIAKESAEKLGKKVTVEMVKDSMHDILASKESVRDQVYDIMFDHFAWLVEDVNFDDDEGSEGEGNEDDNDE